MINKNNLNNYKVYKRKPLKIKIGEYEILQILHQPMEEH